MTKEQRPENMEVVPLTSLVPCDSVRENLNSPVKEELPEKRTTKNKDTNNSGTTSRPPDRLIQRVNPKRPHFSLL